MEGGGPDSGFLFREQAEGQRSRIGGQNTSPSLLSLCTYLPPISYLAFLGGYPSLCAPATLLTLDALTQTPDRRQDNHR